MAEIGVVRRLDESTANKIAAGEVVERPASVVKELVENALDARASSVQVELEEGGRRRIAVTDNGIGMCRDDAVLALERHATSKIRTVEDLFSINTLGFRGEALPSIASVSLMEIITRMESDDAATRVHVSGGERLEVSEMGAPVGTSVSVTDLFFNVPARQKFLKTAQTELGHVLDLLNRFVISHADVKFTVTHNGRTVLESSGSGTEDAILTVLGRDASDAVMPISSEMGPYKVHGFVSKPSYSRRNRSGQFLYVNGRYVRSRSLTHALDEAYRGILPGGRFPVLVAFVEVDPELVDVNVHPTKIEVKFAKDWDAHSLLSSAVRMALSSSSVTPTGEDFLPKRAFVRERRAEYVPSGTLDDFRNALAVRITEQRTDKIVEEQNADEPEALPRVETAPLKDIVVLAQAKNMYIVAQSAAGLLLIDQHVAHERILYDKLSRGAASVPVQRLIVPVTLTLGRREALVLESKLEDVASLGFEIEPFGKDSFVVRSVPALVAEKNYEEILRDIVDELVEVTVARRLVAHRDAVVTTAACRLAVKAGDHLSYEEMTALVTELAETSNPYLCPHGRPIVVSFSDRELQKMFGRI
ncbi:MAG: DNA mismatch repair endonuclease MutL [Armatimonadota bacterium]